jgi:hypothetical protein
MDTNLNNFELFFGCLALPSNLYEGLYRYLQLKHSGNKFLQLVLESPQDPALKDLDEILRSLVDIDLAPAHSELETLVGCHSTPNIIEQLIDVKTSNLDLLKLVSDTMNYAFYSQPTHLSSSRSYSYPFDFKIKFFIEPCKSSDDRLRINKHESHETCLLVRKSVSLTRAHRCETHSLP